MRRTPAPAASIGTRWASRWFVEQTRDEARAQMVGFTPERIADATLDILGTPSADEQRVSPDVERILGRPASTFAGWAARNAVVFK